MYIYAIIDSRNICVGVSYLCGEVVQDNMIRIDEETAKTVLGMRYTADGWKEVPPSTIPLLPSPDIEPGAVESPYGTVSLLRMLSPINSGAVFFSFAFDTTSPIIAGGTVFVSVSDVPVSKGVFVISASHPDVYAEVADEANGLVITLENKSDAAIDGRISVSGWYSARLI